VKPVYKSFRKPQFIATYHFLVTISVITICQYLYDSGINLLQNKIIGTPSVFGLPLVVKEETDILIDKKKYAPPPLNAVDTLILQFKPSNFIASRKTISEPISIDLNSCDSIQLTCIKGIGPATASRILKYRNRLGGFVSKFQLLEVKFFDSSVLLNNHTNWLIDTNKVNKIEISDVNIKALYRHPYIGKDLTIRLLAFKKFHKKISLNDFAEMQTIAPIQKKILPLYLMFDQSVK